MDFQRDTYFTAFYHLTFSTKHRLRLLTPRIQLVLQRYIVAFCKDQKVKLLIVNGVRDHIHLLFFVSSPAFDRPGFVRELKKSTNKLCNNELGYMGQFAWQSGYFAHALGRDRVDSCYEYIKDQQKHHIGMTFAEEWEMMKEAYEKDLEAIASHVME